jgi:hypothetical protein
MDEKETTTDKTKMFDCKVWVQIEARNEEDAIERLKRLPLVTSVEYVEGCDED